MELTVVWKLQYLFSFLCSRTGEKKKRKELQWFVREGWTTIQRILRRLFLSDNHRVIELIELWSNGNIGTYDETKVRVNILNYDEFDDTLIEIKFHGREAFISKFQKIAQEKKRRKKKKKKERKRKPERHVETSQNSAIRSPLQSLATSKRCTEKNVHSAGTFPTSFLATF